MFEASTQASSSTTAQTTASSSTTAQTTHAKSDVNVFTVVGTWVGTRNDKVHQIEIVRKDAVRIYYRLWESRATGVLKFEDDWWQGNVGTGYIGLQRTLEGHIRTRYRETMAEDWVESTTFKKAHVVTYRLVDGQYTGPGDPSNGRAHGIGRLKYDSGDIFTGRFDDGVLEYGVTCDRLGFPLRTMSDKIWNEFIVLPTVRRFGCEQATAQSLFDDPVSDADSLLESIFDQALSTATLSDDGFHTTSTLPRALEVTSQVAGNGFEGIYALFSHRVNSEPAWMSQKGARFSLIYYSHDGWRIRRVDKIFPSLEIRPFPCAAGPRRGLPFGANAIFKYGATQLIVRESGSLDGPAVGRATLPWHGDIDIFNSDAEYIVGKEHNKVGTGYKLQNLDLRDSDVFLDIGAHVGVICLGALQQGAGRVVAVEPSHATAQCLRTNLQSAVDADKAIIVERALARSQTKIVPMFLSKNRQFFNSAMSGRQKASHTQPQYASAITATQLLEKFRPTVVKLDCEGSENIFTEARMSPAWMKIRLVFGEYDFKHNPKLQDKLDFEDAWEETGFHFSMAGLPDCESVLNEQTGQIETFFKFEGAANMNTGRVFTATRCTNDLDFCALCRGETRKRKRARVARA